MYARTAAALLSTLWVGACSHGSAVNAADARQATDTVVRKAEYLRYGGVMIDNHAYPFDQGDGDCIKRFLTRRVHVGPHATSKAPSTMAWSIVNGCRGFSEEQKKKHGLGTCDRLSVRFAKWEYYQDEKAPDRDGVAIQASDLFASCRAQDPTGGATTPLTIGEAFTVTDLTMGSASEVRCTVKGEAAGKHPKRGQYAFVVQLLACNDEGKIIDNRDPVLDYP